MAGRNEMVLYYNPGRPDTTKHVAAMKGVLVRMGVRIRNVGPEQTGETVGFLAGIPGFARAEEQDGGELPVIPEEILVLKQFSSGRLDELLLSLRRAGVPRIALKAVLTEHNSKWTFYHLYEELSAEHSAMARQEAASAARRREEEAGRT